MDLVRDARLERLVSARYPSNATKRLWRTPQRLGVAAQ